METFLPIATNFAVVGVVILIVVVLVLGLAALRARVRQPALSAVLDVLGEFALKAVYGAESLAYEAFTKLDNKVESWDKKAIADAIYDTLPDTILVAGRPVPIGIIKMLVPRAVWQDLVQRKFGEADAFIHRQRDYLIKQIDGLAEDLKRADEAPKIDTAEAVG